LLIQVEPFFFIGSKTSCFCLPSSSSRALIVIPSQHSIGLLSTTNRTILVELLRKFFGRASLLPLQSKATKITLEQWEQMEMESLNSGLPTLADASIKAFGDTEFGFLTLRI